MNAATLAPGGLAFASASAEPSFPLAGAALLIILLLGAAAIIVWARSRRGTSWCAPWVMSNGTNTEGTQAPRHLSSLRLDAAHRLHVIAWDNREFLIATGLNVAPVVVATAPPGASLPLRESTPPTVQG